APGLRQNGRPRSSFISSRESSVDVLAYGHGNHSRPGVFKAPRHHPVPTPAMSMTEAGSSADMSSHDHVQSELVATAKKIRRDHDHDRLLLLTQALEHLTPLLDIRHQLEKSRADHERNQRKNLSRFSTKNAGQSHAKYYARTENIRIGECYETFAQFMDVLEEFKQGAEGIRETPPSAGASLTTNNMIRLFSEMNRDERGHSPSAMTTMTWKTSKTGQKRADVGDEYVFDGTPYGHPGKFFIMRCPECYLDEANPKLFDKHPFHRNSGLNHFIKAGRHQMRTWGEMKLFETYCSQVRGVDAAWAAKHNENLGRKKGVGNRGNHQHDKAPVLQNGSGHRENKEYLHDGDDDDDDDALQADDDEDLTGGYSLRPRKAVNYGPFFSTPSPNPTPRKRLKLQR
ncbi:hypothetical protein F4778DRAFT_798557, partial [Xylariomycetidae sp. FL2044]